jgi:hypothetical protein
MQKSLVILTTLTLVASILLAGCGSEQEKGTLEFYANGEDFVRQGFVSKDGWHITFEHVYVTLAEVTAYQTDPPYDAHEGSEVQAQETAKLDQTYTVDLAKGGEDASSILVGKVSDAPAGHYNAIQWKMALASSGPTTGDALVIVGQAAKDGESVNFTLRIDQEYTYTCGEYVGDARKGNLEKDGTADLEMTFHFDHIFGDAETPMDDELNLGALGFEPFSGYMAIDLDLYGMENSLSAEEYQKLMDILPSLGHVGEGHCHCETN